MITTRLTLALAAALTMSSMTTRALAAEPKIAVVDLQRAISETEDGRKAKARLKKLFEQRQKGLDAKQNKLKKMQGELEKQKAVLSPDAFQRKLEDYQKQVLQLQQVYVEYQRELASKEGELTQKIYERMTKILRRIGQSKGYTLIMERNAGVIFVPTNLDLTDLVIQKYNKGEGK